MEVPVPEEVIQSLSGMDERLQRLEEHVRKLLISWSPSSLALLSPAERASAYMAVSKALNAVYCLFLRSRGESPDEHPVKSELDRVSLYDEKVEYACERSKAPRPSMSLDIRAANRFIEHAIPELTPEQKMLVREAGKRNKNNSSNNDSNKKLKTSELSVAEAAAAFLMEVENEVPGQD